MRWFWCVLVLACGGSSIPAGDAEWSIYVSPDAPEAVRWAANDIATYLGQMGESAAVVEHQGEVRCGNASRVVLAGDGLNDRSLEGATDQTFRIAAEECAGRFVELSGGGLLGRQYAAYEWLHSLGVRFFHPEEEFVPARVAFEALEREHTPAYTYRSVSLHLTHPLELGDAFRLEDERYLEDGRRYIDWLIKNLASFGHTGVGTGDLSDYGLRRGLPRSSGMRLYGAQQGDTSILDPDDPRSDEEQIADAIEARVGETPPDFFSVGFDPSEFLEAPDEDVVRQLTFVANYFAENYPSVQLQTTVHGTAGEPTENFDVRYYDLPQFAPGNLGVKVHPLMFYDVFRPAPVYGNTDFTNLYDFMVQEAPNRQVWYFPEAAWWLTFDIPIPLYLPITIEARDRDIQGLAPLLAQGLDGHRVFGSGHEWGYWQNEYCSFRMASDLSYRWTDCIDDITAPMGAAGAEVSAILQEVVARQAEFMFDEEALRWLVGTDPETEIAAGIGVVFHPLPPSPSEILRWSEEEVEAFETTALPLLQGIERDFFFFGNRLRALDVPDGAQNIFQEIVDGVDAFRLRAKHQWQAYGALVMVRAARLRGEPSLIADAEQQLLDAAQTTEETIEVIRRREEGYRYLPIERSIAGGADGSEDENWTIYRYRYLNRTHHAYYYTRVDAMAEEAFAGAARTVNVDDAVIGPAETFSLSLNESLTSPGVDYGDGTTAASAPFTHTYAPGVYECVVTGSLAGDEFREAIPVAAVREEHRTGFSGRVILPAGAEIIEGVLPALVFGPVDELGPDGQLALGFALDETSHAVAPADWLALRGTSGERFENAPTSVEVPVVNRSSGSALTSIIVEDAVLTHEGERATLRGALLSEGVVQAVVSIGGFDEQGARRILATTLGFTPETLPERLDFEVAFDVLP